MQYISFNHFQDTWVEYLTALLDLTARQKSAEITAVHCSCGIHYAGF